MHSNQAPQASRYPSNAFPDQIRDAIHEAEINIDAPTALIAGSALTALSMACQGILDVELPTGSIVPCSLFVVTIAASGERKTTADNKLTQAIRQHEEASRLTHAQEMTEFRVNLTIWQGKYSAIRKQMEKATIQDIPSEDIEEKLRNHILKKPIPPALRTVTLQNATPEAIVQNLACPDVSAGLISDEGGILLNGRTMSNTPMLNKLWDGGHIHQSRVGTGESIVSGARLTVSIMVQPKTFERFLANREDIPRDNGFLARALICFPQSTQGRRFSFGITPLWEKNKEFQDLLSHILIASDQRAISGATRQISKLTHDAKLAWLDSYNKLERTLAPNEYFSDIKDFASKFCEIATRVAAIFQYATDKEFYITGDTMARALFVCDWYLSEFKRLFGQNIGTTQEEADAMLLESWLRERDAKSRLPTPLTVNYLSQYAPNRVRNKTRRDAALDVLESEGKIMRAYDRNRLCILPGPMFRLTAPSGLSTNEWPSFNF